MGHAISNLTLGVGQSFLCPREGVGHVFFINHISKCSGPTPPPPPHTFWPVPKVASLKACHLKKIETELTYINDTGDHAWKQNCGTYTKDCDGMTVWLRHFPLGPLSPSINYFYFNLNNATFLLRWEWKITLTCKWYMYIYVQSRLCSKENWREPSALKL